jgi:hypothetical protein
VKVDDPITIVQDRLLVHARLGVPGATDTPFAGRYHTHRYGVGGYVELPTVALADEGITWCRGHLNALHPDGAALLAGEALKDENAEAKSCGFGTNFLPNP